MFVPSDAPADWELYESQTKRFRNFIIRANRYPTLQFSGEEEGGGVVGGDTVSKTGRDKVVLVEVGVAVGGSTGRGRYSSGWVYR